jgi:hypothetical protein
MKFDKLKKGVVTLALTGSILLGAGAVNPTFAQGRWGWEGRRAERMEREREREELARIREMDRYRQLRYRYQGGNRLVGYYDRFGGFHATGYYDRFGRFWRYQ